MRDSFCRNHRLQRSCRFVIELILWHRWIDRALINNFGLAVSVFLLTIIEVPMHISVYCSIQIVENKNSSFKITFWFISAEINYFIFMSSILRNFISSRSTVSYCVLRSFAVFMLKAVRSEVFMYYFFDPRFLSVCWCWCIGAVFICVDVYVLAPSSYELMLMYCSCFSISPISIYVPTPIPDSNTSKFKSNISKIFVRLIW